jgi:hypothetical protein
MELRRAYEFPELAEGKDTRIVEVIKDVAGVARYQLECHSGDYEGPSLISYSGLFHCGLFPMRANVPIRPNLLAQDTPDGNSSDWFNRGRFRATQLQGTCAGYSEYSDTRTFRLRQMAITLTLTQVVWSKANVPKSFAVNIHVRPDSSASSMRAAAPSVPAPPEPCYP